jgi:hypothetical protein
MVGLAKDLGGIWVLLIAAIFNLAVIVSDRIFTLKGSEQGFELDVRDAVEGFVEEIKAKEIDKIIEVDHLASEARFRSARNAKELSRVASDLMFENVVAAIAERESLTHDEREEIFRAKSLGPVIDVLFKERS